MCVGCDKIVDVGLVVHTAELNVAVAYLCCFGCCYINIIEDVLVVCFGWLNKIRCASFDICCLSKCEDIAVGTNILANLCTFAKSSNNLLSSKVEW